MSELIGYARVSTSEQDLQPQLDGLARLGVTERRIYIDRATGRNRERPGLREALAACHEGSTLVVTKLDRLGRSLMDLHSIGKELEEHGARLSIGGEVHDPKSPTGRLFFSMLATIAEFESDLISQRTREGMVVAKRNGRLKGKQTKFKPSDDATMLYLHESGERTVGEIAEMFHVSRATIYRAFERARQRRSLPQDGVGP